MGVGTFLVKQKHLLHPKNAFRYPNVAMLWQGVRRSDYGGLKREMERVFPKRCGSDDFVQSEHIDSVAFPFTF